MMAQGWGEEDHGLDHAVFYSFPVSACGDRLSRSHSESPDRPSRLLLGPLPSVKSTYTIGPAKHRRGDHDGQMSISPVRPDGGRPSHLDKAAGSS